MVDAVDEMPSICQENDPWERYELTLIEDDFTNKESHPSSSINLQNIELAERNSTKDEIEVKLARSQKKIVTSRSSPPPAWARPACDPSAGSTRSRSSTARSSAS